MLPSVYAGIFEIASIGPMPRHIFEPLIEAEGAAAVNSFWGVDTDVSTIVGNGPFLIADYVPSQRVVMTPNPNYYEQDEWGQQLPYLDEFVIEFVEDQDTGLARFVAGETDAWGLRGEDYGVLVDKQEADNFLIYNVGPASSTQFITFNQNPIEGEEDGGIEPPALTWLSNKTFRQAMAHLIDRQTIINNIAFGFGYPQYSFVWTVSPYYWQGAADRRLQVRPGTCQGVARLDRLRRPRRRRRARGSGRQQDRADPEHQLRQRRARADRRAVQPGGERGRRRRDLQAGGVQRAGHAAGLVLRLADDPDRPDRLGRPGGRRQRVSVARQPAHDGAQPGVAAPRLGSGGGRRLDEANLTTDEEQRTRGFRKLQELWIDEVPWAYTFAPAVMHAYRNTVGNIKPHPLNGYGIRGIADRLYVK